MISPQQYQPDWRENIEPDLETMRHRGLMVTVSPTRNLYTISTFTPNIIHNPHLPPSAPYTSLYAARVPDVETWHRQLGHCNTWAIIDMAQNNVTKGMPIDLSAMLPKCDFCILGKQAYTLVPKMREGLRATR